MLRIIDLSLKYPLATDFWRYVEEQWLFKAYMWVVGYRELLYVGQDINATIEGYHATLKAMLKSGKCCMLGCRVDWLVHELIGEVLTCFWYQNLRKCFGFVMNKRCTTYGTQRPSHCPFLQQTSRGVHNIQSRLRMGVLLLFTS